jgi:hypothetical protein
VLLFNLVAPFLFGVSSEEMPGKSFPCCINFLGVFILGQENDCLFVFYLKICAILKSYFQSVKTKRISRTLKGKCGSFLSCARTHSHTHS